MKTNKQLIITLGVIFFLTLIVLVVVISSFFSTSQKPSPGNIPTPTNAPYTRDKDGVFIFTPLQKTTINKTTEKEIEAKDKVISKTHLGNVTLYKVTSNTVGETDEIRTEDGVVIFESTNIFNKKAGGYPPKVSVYEKEFGNPEKILKGVSPLGKFISAYIYATKGFTLLVNYNTNTVYIVQRFVPMSLETYQKTYAEYLQPAPEYPKESFQQ